MQNPINQPDPPWNKENVPNRNLRRTTSYAAGSVPDPHIKASQNDYGKDQMGERYLVWLVPCQHPASATPRSAPVSPSISRCYRGVKTSETTRLSVVALGTVVRTRTREFNADDHIPAGEASSAALNPSETPLPTGSESGVRIRLMVLSALCL